MNYTGIPKDVADSYGMCLERDDFIIDKCIWVVDLADGTKVFQDDDRPGAQHPSAWVRLGFYVKDWPGNPIAKMRLRFGTHVVEIPSNMPYYFYSKGLVQGMTQSVGLNFHIVGTPFVESPSEILCDWYKSPELVFVENKIKKLDDCNPLQIIGGNCKLDT